MAAMAAMAAIPLGAHCVPHSPPTHSLLQVPLQIPFQHFNSLYTQLILIFEMSLINDCSFTTGDLIYDISMTLEWAVETSAAQLNSNS